MLYRFQANLVNQYKYIIEQLKEFLDLKCCTQQGQYTYKSISQSINTNIIMREMMNIKNKNLK
jgi:hypothetical protein